METFKVADIDVTLSRAAEASVLLLGNSNFSTQAARVCRADCSIEEVASETKNVNLVKRVLGCGHMGIAEFMNFTFAIEGFPRVTEVQLVRKRMASYAIQSGRICRDKLRFVIPDSYEYNDIRDTISNSVAAYSNELSKGIPAEQAREFLPQCLSFKAVLQMNGRSLYEFFEQRCCRRAQTEINILANKMLVAVRRVEPILFANAGATCVAKGYCKEGSAQCLWGVNNNIPKK